MSTPNTLVKNSILSIPSKTTNVNSNTPLQSILAGGITGGIEACITYPTEFVKTQLQLDERSAKRRFNGILDVARQTTGQYGITGLYRGLSVLVCGNFPKVAIRFSVFEAVKKRVSNEQGQLSAYQRMACGLAAGSTEAIIVVTPMETIKVKFIDDLNSTKPKYRGLLHGVREIVREQGIRGTYQGMVATIARQGSNQAIRFFVVESLKDWYRGKDENPNKPVNGFVTATFGGIAGAVSVSV